MKKYKTIKALVKAAKAGKVDESQLTVVMDDDCSSVYLGECEDDKGNDIDNEIWSGDGHYDCQELWALLLPKATVEWW